MSNQILTLYNLDFDLDKIFNNDWGYVQLMKVDGQEYPAGVALMVAATKQVAGNSQDISVIAVTVENAKVETLAAKDSANLEANKAEQEANRAEQEANRAEQQANRATGAAGFIDLPSLSANEYGKILAVNSDGTGYVLTNAITLIGLTVSNALTTKDLTASGSATATDLTVSNALTTKDLTVSGNTTINWANVNDGAGSGLDADKLDGLEASQFMRSSELSNINTRMANQEAALRSAIANIKQPKIVFKGWSSTHGRAGATYQRVPFDWQPIPAKSPYCTVPNGSTTITINRAGLYRFDVFITKHKNQMNGWGHTLILHNGNTVVKTHERIVLSGSWQAFTPNYSAHFNAGDTLRVDSYQQGANPYNWYLGGEMSHATLTYLGD